MSLELQRTRLVPGSTWPACAVAFTITFLGLTHADAQSVVLVDLEGTVSGPIASPQLDRFGWGGHFALGVRAPISAWIVATARLHALVLADGARPTDATLADPGVGWLGRAAVGLRLHARGLSAPQDLRRGDGAWLELAVGAALTGAVVRPTFEAALGWAFAVSDVDIGPLVRLEQVLHFDDPLDSASAFLLSIGLEVVLLDSSGVTTAATQEPDDQAVEPLDSCVGVTEGRSRDGCPRADGDRDGDRILDSLDACPDDAEDVDGYEDADGCPDPDDDQDGILDALDACPREPEVVNGIDDEDGCPDEGLITMVDDRIVLEDRVLFELNRARIHHAARPRLAAIVELARQHPEWVRVRIEGHTDERGTEAYNIELSTLRAERVRDALVDLGMPAALLDVVGLGATRPRDTRGTEQAMEANRRVEFVIVGPSPREEGP